LDVVETHGLSPIAAIKESDFAVQILKAVFDDGEQFRLRVRRGGYDQDRSGIEDSQLVNRADVCLTVVDLTEDRFTGVQVDEGQT
jgi:hypothetical protein